MIEQTREIVRKFNQLYGEVLLEPEALVSENARLIGLDGQAKMSKSIGNCIYISDTEEEVTRKVNGMYTDPSRLRASDPGRVEGNPVFVYHDAFNSNLAEVADLKERYKNGKVGDVEVKEKLSVAINKVLQPMRERIRHYESKPELIEEILRAGVEKGRKVSDETLEKVKEAMKINYHF